MIKLIKILTIIITLSFFTPVSYAATSQDCAAYERVKLHEKIANFAAKRRCLKGLPPKEKITMGKRLKKLNPLRLFKK